MKMLTMKQNRMSIKAQCWLAMVFCCMAIAPAYAATGRAISDDVYSGDFSASLSVATVTSVSKLQDVQVAYPATAPIEVYACVFTNAPSQQYKLSLRSQQGGNGNTFYLMNSNGMDTATVVPYYVSIYAHGNTTGEFNVGHNTVQGPYTRLTDTVDCSAAGDQLIKLTLQMATNVDALGLAAGLYTSTLEIQVDAA
jgi:hypothetical protein